MRLAHNVVQIRQSAKKVASSELVLLALFLVPLETRIDRAKLRSTFGTNIDVPGVVCQETWSTNAEPVLPMFPLKSRAGYCFVVVAGSAACLLVACAVRSHARHSSDPVELLARADDLSWKNQWIEAAPVYAEAERRFTQEHRLSEALYAHVSQFVPRAESEPLPQLLLELKGDLELPIAQPAETKLRILVIEGMIETNYDASMARATWERVQSLSQHQGHYLLMARAMGEQGIAAFLLGDIANAKKLTLRAWVTAKYLHDPAAHVRYASVYGAGLAELGRYEEAIHVLDEAIKTAKESSGVAYPTIAVNSKIDALRGLHRYGDALALADETIQRLPRGDLDAHLFQIYTSKGEVYEDLTNWNEAAHQYGEALGYARHLSYWRGIVQTGGLLAQAYEHENRLAEALTSVDEAIRANTQLPQELYFSPRNLAIKAEILARMGRTAESHSLYEKSFALVDSLLATAPTPNVERLLITQMKQGYAGYFELLCNEGHIPAAFRTIEQARGRIESQALASHAFTAPHVPNAQEKEITRLNLKMIETDDPKVRAELSKALYDAELQLDDSTLAGKTASRPMDLKRVQEHLGPTELVLEYVLSKPQSYVLAITKESVHSYHLAAEKTINGLAAQYRKVIRDKKTDPVLAQQLFKSLLSPVVEYRSKRSIIIVPDGDLHLLPFAALINDGSYILRDHAFSVSPSSTVLSLLRDREPATRQDPLDYVGVAAWTLPRPSEMRVGMMPLPPDNRPQPLPESKEEVETIAHNFAPTSTVLLGSDATESRFKALPLDHYRVLHLALHGYANLEYPDRSALVFAPSTTGGDDGLLEVREIRDLHLNARLVTLSACNTGVGPIGEADIANLGNAFVEAGAESVVTTLWELEDRSTEKLMTGFYRSLSQRRSEAEALRLAQLELEQLGLSPYYWASFELVGDPAETI